MKIRTFAELTTPDERTLRFTPLGLSTGGKLRPEDAAEFQQRSVARADLIDSVPDETRRSFERLRHLHSYGVLFYDAFTVAADLSSIVLEQALRQRFVRLYDGPIAVVDKQSTASAIQATDFEVVSSACRPGGTYARGGWKLVLRDGTETMPMPLSLGPLLRWARREELLSGQRNRRVETQILDKIRNRFAHGTDFRIGMPNESAGTICDLAEIINRLWGHATEGGRLYPAPLRREVLVIGWSPDFPGGEVGSTLAVMHPHQIADHEMDWTFIVLKAVWHDELQTFDTRYERTTYPADYLWGPGGSEDVRRWLELKQPEGDQVEYLDRLFAVRHEGNKVYLPCRPAALLGLPKEDGAGAWYLVRADFPGDALEHARHLAAGAECRDAEERPYGCASETVAEGNRTKVEALIRRGQPDLAPAAPQRVRVPSPYSAPDSIDV